MQTELTWSGSLSKPAAGHRVLGMGEETSIAKRSHSCLCDIHHTGSPTAEGSSALISTPSRPSHGLCHFSLSAEGSVAVAVPTSVASPPLTLNKVTAMSPLDLQGSSPTCYEGQLHLPGATARSGWGESENTVSSQIYKTWPLSSAGY